jgi:serine/threonine protein kinase
MPTREAAVVPPCVQCKTELAYGARVCPSCRALQPLAAHHGPVAKGTTIDLGYGRVVIDERIGEGGMGVVWRGWLFYAPGDPRATDKPIPLALKVLRPQVSLQTEVRTLFFNEAEALKRLSHPNIVRFHDFFEWGPGLALAMEFVDGNTLDEVIARHVARAQIAGTGALPAMAFRRGWYYFQQLLGALAATHALSIVHRDVKPANVLVRRDGIVKLTDFGIARLLRPDDAPSHHSQGIAPGTGAYMAPEQVLSRPLDGRTDLYAAAIVFYEMLAGRPPFSPDNKSEFILRQEQVQAPPPPIRTFLPQAPPMLDGLFARALAKDPTYRFGSAIEMGNAFRTALGLADTPEWQAQAEIARHAPEPELPADQTAREQRLATLREFVVKGYKTANMASQQM